MSCLLLIAGTCSPIATLLAALKEARQYVMLYSPSGRPFDFPKETIARIDAAIARAEGRSDG